MYNLEPYFALIDELCKKWNFEFMMDDAWFKVVHEHDSLGRDVELFRMHFYALDKPKLVVKGVELVEGLEIKSHDYKLVKTRFSAFL